MEDTLASDLDLISITQLRQVANQTPQPYRLHLQVESRIEKATSSGSPFYEVKLVDAGDSFVWRVFDNHPLFQDAAKLTRNSFIELAGQWVEGKYGLEPRQVQMRALADEEMSTLLLGDPDLAARQQADYADIVAFIHRRILPGDEVRSAETELLLAKHRNGPTGSVPMTYEGPFFTYREVERHTALLLTCACACHPGASKYAMQPYATVCFPCKPHHHA
jgi:replicative DNA helicase